MCLQRKQVMIETLHAQTKVIVCMQAAECVVTSSPFHPNHLPSYHHSHALA